MKKSLFLMAIATVAISSCSSDETLQVNRGNSIEFRAAMGTRATEEFETGDLTSFNVTALAENNTETYFSNVSFVSDYQTSPTYTSNPSHYWPTNGKSLNFYAWANAAGSKTPTIDASSQIIPEFTPSTTVASQLDVVVANATGNNTNTNGVSMTFKHALSQINIKAKNSNKDSQYKIKIKAVKIGCVSNTADLPITSAETLEPESASTTKESYTVTFDKEKELTPAENPTAEELMSLAMLIPQQLVEWDRTTAQGRDNTNNGAYISVLVDIDTKTDANIYPQKGYAGGYAWAAIPIDTKWVRNTKYTYVLDFANGAGYVDPHGPDGEPNNKDDDENKDTDEDWQPGDEIINTDPANVIKFVSVTVDDWDETNPAETNVPMKETTTP